MVYLIEATNPSEAWLEATKFILENRKNVSGLKEILHLVVEIENPTQINEKIDQTFKEILILGKKSGKECNCNLGKVVCFFCSAHIRSSELKEIEKVVEWLKFR